MSLLKSTSQGLLHQWKGFNPNRKKSASAIAILSGYTKTQYPSSVIGPVKGIQSSTLYPYHTLSFSFNRNLKSVIHPRFPHRNQTRGITTDADQHFILTATGPDRVGIVSDIAKIVLDNDGDIAESRMVRMGGDFTAMMRACATKSSVETITNKLYNLQSVHCLVHYVSNHDFQTDTKPVWEASVTLQGANHPGIIFRLTDLMKKYSIRVQDMHTDTELAPLGGTQLFLLDAIVVSDQTFDTKKFYEEVNQLENHLGIDIDFEEINGYDDQNQLKSETAINVATNPGVDKDLQL